MKLCVVFGGMSTEHEVSIVSMSSIIKNLNKEKYEITPVYISKKGEWFLYKKTIEAIKNIKIGKEIKDIQKIPNIIEFLKSQDVIFPILHGLYGEDGKLQGMLEMIQKPYVGCKVLTSSMCMDKIYTKIILKNAGIKQAKSMNIKYIENGKILLENEEIELEKLIDKIIDNLGNTVFIKPSNSGSSVGVSKARSKEEIKKGIIKATKYDRKILIEEEIKGRELEVAILGNDMPKCSIVGEILPSEEFYTYDAKYKSVSSKVIIPAKIQKEKQEEIQKIAIRAFRAVEGRGLSRIDFFMQEKTNDIYLNEINTMPGFTEISMYPQLWEKCGLSYEKLLDELIKLAI